ncbi:MAG: type II toxin-antitoxin system RelE/ParE family toxin [Balneolaceae bacterium]|nr:type II toxin-antitoxin system RelE/ParE family toxin [Balneolaceae bacterium]
MALDIIWTISAQKDRIRVFEYWNERTQSREYSQKLNRSISHRISLIKEYPSAGLSTDKPGVRFHVIARHYKLFYRIQENNAYYIAILGYPSEPG